MSDRKGQYTKTDGASETIDVQAGLNFNKSFGDHFLFANLTWNLSSNNNRSFTAVGEGFGNDNMDDIFFATKYETYGKPSGSSAKTREIGIIGAFNYSYAERYLFDASVRRSASSVYGSDNRWGTFWRGIIGSRISSCALPWAIRERRTSTPPRLVTVMSITITRMAI